MHTIALAMSVTAHLSRAEYLALPEAPDGLRCELLDGELVTMNAPLALHQVVTGALHAELRAWARAAPGRGQALIHIDTDIAHDTVLGPDIQWYAADRVLPSLQERPWPPGDLVIEIASPSTARYDALAKAPRYARAGVRELWLVSPDPLAVRTFRNDGGRFVEASRFGPDDRLESPRLPGFSVRVGDLLQ